jgi:hypothetical protein
MGSRRTGGPILIATKATLFMRQDLAAWAPVILFLWFRGVKRCAIADLFLHWDVLCSALAALCKLQGLCCNQEIDGKQVSTKESQECPRAVSIDRP